MRHGIISSCTPISCHFRDCKALLVLSLASTQTFTFTFTFTFTKGGKYCVNHSKVGLSFLGTQSGSGVCSHRQTDTTESDVIRTRMMKCSKKQRLKAKSTIWLLFSLHGVQDSTNIPGLTNNTSRSTVFSYDTTTYNVHLQHLAACVYTDRVWRVSVAYSNWVSL